MCRCTCVSVGGTSRAAPSLVVLCYLTSSLHLQPYPRCSAAKLISVLFSASCIISHMPSVMPYRLRQLAPDKARLAASDAPQTFTDHDNISCTTRTSDVSRKLPFDACCDDRPVSGTDICGYMLEAPRSRPLFRPAVCSKEYSHPVQASCIS